MKKIYKGQALVEFAVSLILLLTIMFGIIEWGLYLFSRITIDTAVRDAVRTGVTFNDWTVNENSRTEEIRNLIQGRTAMLPTAVHTGLSNRVVVSFEPNITNLETLTVEVRNQPYNSISGFFNVILPNSISAEASMRYERR